MLADWLLAAYMTKASPDQATDNSRQATVYITRGISKPWSRSPGTLLRRLTGLCGSVSASPAHHMKVGQRGHFVANGISKCAIYDPVRLKILVAQQPPRTSEASCPPLATRTNLELRTASAPQTATQARGDSAGSRCAESTRAIGRLSGYSLGA